MEKRENQAESREKHKQEIELRRKVYSLIDRISKKIGVEIPKQEYPKINFAEYTKPRYNLALNTFNLPYQAINSGNVLGEEIAHFIRSQTREIDYKKPLPKFVYYLLHPSGNELNRVPNQSKIEKHADEFFGYLGRKILEEVAKPEDELKFKKDLHSKEEIMQKLREIKSKKTSTNVNKKYLKNQRKSILEHRRAYEFADAFDLSNVTDYSQLFSMSDQEVRHRFFREDPQYDLTKPIQPGKIRRKTQKESGLETTLKLIGTIGIFFLFILSINPKNLTGYVINTENPVNLNSIAILTMIILFIIAILINYKKRFIRM